MAEKLPQKFPWRQGNHIRFLVDGIQFFPAMLNAIANAKNFVLMEMYLFESGKIADKFIKAFTEATKRGIVVQLLIDDFGGKGLSQNDRNALTNAGVQLTFYNPVIYKKLKNNLRRTHRKYLIIDDETVFVGGAGITDNFDGKNAWRETVVEINGRVVIDWHALFKESFQQCSQLNVPEVLKVADINNENQARVSYTIGGELLEIKRVLLNKINNCHDKIWFASAYFIPSRKIRKALCKAAAKGNDVRLLLPGPVTDHPSVRYASRRYYAKLLRSGVRIFEYQKRFTHTKTVLVDDWFTLGSANIDRWNFRWNLEANLEVISKEHAQTLKQIMLNDFDNCNEIHYKLWVNRSKLQRFKEWLWGKVDIWLTKNM